MHRPSRRMKAPDDAICVENRRCFRGGLGCLLASKWVRFGFVFRHIFLILLRILASFCRIFCRGPAEHGGDPTAGRRAAFM